MKPRLGRVLLGAVIALAVPLSCVAVGTAGIAGATSPNNTVTATFIFDSPNVTAFSGSSTCSSTGVTTTSSSVGAFSASCTTTGTSYGNLPSHSTTTLTVPSDGFTNVSSTGMTLNANVTFEDTFGSTGSCTINFTGTVPFSSTTGYKYYVTDQSTDGNVDIVADPTDDTLCTAISRLLNHTGAYFNAEFTFTNQI